MIMIKYFLFNFTSFCATVSFTTSITLLKSIRVDSNLAIFNGSFSDFKLAKSSFSAKFDASASVAFF